MFRQHSWETGSSWAGEGAVRALLRDDAESRRLRQTVIWKIFPLCDPDGVARGGVRFNVNGYDLNRNWDIEDAVKMPEMRRSAMPSAIGFAAATRSTCSSRCTTRRPANIWKVRRTDLSRWRSVSSGRYRTKPPSPRPARCVSPGPPPPLAWWGA